MTALVVAEDAYARPLATGGAVLNGAGECTGFIGAGEWGMLETPIYLTSTMQLGRVYDSACRIELERDVRVADAVVIPVVGECDDSFLNDCRRMQVGHEDVVGAHAAALASRGAGTPPPEGAVGAGTGMSCLGFKGGIGTSSRVTPEGHTVAVLLLTNFGERKRLTVDGHHLGRLLPEDPDPVAAGRLVHRRRRHGRAGDQRRLRPARPADRSRVWPAPGRPPTTAAARSSWPSPRPGGRRTCPGRRAPWSRAPASTTCSKQWSTRPRRRCSTRC